MGVKLIFIISLMHTLLDKVRFVQRKLKPEGAFMTKKWMVLAEHLLAQAHMQHVSLPICLGVLVVCKPAFKLIKVTLVVVMCMRA